MISPSGYVLTARHVVEAGPAIDSLDITGAVASSAASRSSLTLMAKDDHDVALLKFTDTSHPLHSGQSLAEG